MSIGHLLDPERIGDPPHLPGGVDQQHIEADPGFTPLGVLAHDDPGGGDQARALALR